jgi:hypothetical protein
VKAFAALATVVALAACGGDEEEAREPEPEPRPTQLQVVVRTPDLGGGGRRFDLSCDPPGGDHPNAEAACAALAAHSEAIEAVPPDTACTQIFGGPEQAEVTGLFRGRDVEATFDRSNGCEIDRWDRLAALFDVTP